MDDDDSSEPAQEQFYETSGKKGRKQINETNMSSGEGVVQIMTI